MDFVINNPNMPPQMFNGQPVNMPLYQNPQFTFNHFDTKKLILFYTNASSAQPTKPGDPHEFGYTYNRITTPGSTITTYSSSGVPSSKPVNSGSFTSAVYGSDPGTFTFTLQEPLQIDKISDVFLDNFSLSNASFNASDTPAHYGVVLKIDQLKQNVVSNNQLINNGEFIVVNSSTDPELSKNTRPTFYETKSKKFNYLGVIQPGRYKTITGKLSDLDNKSIKSLTSAKNFCFSIELVISNKSD